MIILTTFNARYTHTSIALRYLYANMQEFQGRTHILEFVINENVQNIAEKILEYKPKIIGIGVYIWNVKEVKELIDIVKLVAPDIKIVLGGPEVSFEPFRENYSNADYILQGEADLSFYQLCRDILDSKELPKVIKSQKPDLNLINTPYRYYSDEDIKNRQIYVELSRGCPFECEFCLSSIDSIVRVFDLESILNEFEELWQRGVRGFKFIDRTFNLNIAVANRVLDFFLSKEPPFFVHFEVIPDNFPQAIKDKIMLFPPATLQFEVGIQTLNPLIAKNINRKLNLEKIVENVKFLENLTDIHLHFDLIVGLPQENLESFANNLNTLTSLSRAEIQIGILKKLSGTSIARHDKSSEMLYSDKPPYDILQTSTLSFFEIQEMKRFARFWDIFYNSGNFRDSIYLLFKDIDVFNGFLNFTKWVYKESETTWQISLNRASEFLFKYLVEIKLNDKREVATLIINDILRLEGRKLPPFLREYYDLSLNDNTISKSKNDMYKQQLRQLKRII